MSIVGYDVQKTHDIAFVGNIFPGARRTYCCAGSKGGFAQCLWGRGYFRGNGPDLLGRAAAVQLQLEERR